MVMGTSLKVQPFADLVGQEPVGTPRILINRDRVGERYLVRGFDFESPGTADVFLQGDCDDGCLTIAKLLNWEEDLERLMRTAT
jgi:hypothetical protein